MNKQACVVLFVLTSCAPGSTQSTVEPAAPPQQTAGDRDGFEVVHGWPVLPDGHALGQAVGVAVDSHNHVFVFHRAGREWTKEFKEPIDEPTIIVFDGATGSVVAEWGEGTFIMPHGLEVDSEDNVWVTDVGLHQVFKFSHSGELLQTLGVAGESGSDATHFNLPTDVAAVPGGGVYISDGYGNARVAKYDASGAFQFEWGTEGAGAGQFRLPHGIDVDSKGRVYVADRTNGRVQVFEGDGSYLSEWKSDELGRPFAVSIGPDGLAYVIDGGDPPLTRPARSRIVRLTLAGTVTGRYGRYGNHDGQFIMGHDIAAASDALYVVDVHGKRVQKFTTNPKN